MTTTCPDPVLDAFLAVANELFDTLDGVLTECGDRFVNVVPDDVPGINSVYALTIHISGAIAFWGGSFVSGENIPRDRDAEFRATGTVAQARESLAHTRAALPGWSTTARTRGILDRTAKGDDAHRHRHRHTGIRARAHPAGACTTRRTRADLQGRGARRGATYRPARYSSNVTAPNGSPGTR